MFFIAMPIDLYLPCWVLPSNHTHTDTGYRPQHTHTHTDTPHTKKAHTHRHTTYQKGADCLLVCLGNAFPCPVGPINNAQELILGVLAGGVGETVLEEINDSLVFGVPGRCQADESRAHVPNCGTPCGTRRRTAEGRWPSVRCRGTCMALHREVLVTVVLLCSIPNEDTGPNGVVQQERCVFDSGRIE